MAEAIVTPCIECFKCAGPPLKKHLYDFSENVDDFLKKKSDLKAKKDSYDQRLAIAIMKKELPTEDVKSWIQQYEAIITKCELPEYNEDELERKRSRRRYTIKRYKFSRKLLKMTIEMTELINRYTGFRSLFVEDLVRKNTDILKNFEDTKQKFDALIQTYEGRRVSAEKNHKIPTESVRLWRNDCAKLQTKYDGGNAEIEVEGESSDRQEEGIGQMKEMENLINQYKEFGGSSEMFVDQPLQIVEKRSTDFMSLSSMENNKNRVYKALSDGERVIKLFGMGGVGKTTLMKQINNEMSGGTDFELVIWVTVSTTYADIKDIQSQICHRLNLQCSDREEDTVRAEKISEYLKECVDGSCLFIFDDVWRELDLKAIGIPDGNYGNEEMKCCKIVLTTRDRNVKVIHPTPPKDIEMKGLDEAESWILFKRYASIEDEDNNIDDGIKEVAEKVCKKCAGLPLVIRVVAKMLYREEEKGIWYETLTFLDKDDSSLDIPDHYFQNVYVPLKLSYKRLGRKDLKMGFLLCGLFPEDCEFRESDLICYGIGAGEIAKSCQRLNACRNIFIHLKNKGLLQDGIYDDSSAKMHDVIRDVAHFIAKKKFGGFFCNAELTKWIFSEQNFVDQPENVLLVDLTDTSIELDRAMLYIKKLKELRVLMLNNFYHEIPVNIKEYFILHELSVLRLQGALIEELDKEFSIQLCNLRVIDFSDTYIDVIRPKAFSNLHNKLEVLCMKQSFKKWRATDEEDGEYASFAELAELKKLYSLHVDIDDKDIFSPEYRPDVVFSSVEWFSINSSGYFGRWNSKALVLPSQRLVKNGANWIKDLLKKTEDLEIDNTEIKEIHAYSMG